MPPLGISYLAAFLRPEFDVSLLDAAIEGYGIERRLDNGFLVYGLPEDEICQRVLALNADIVGISCLFSSQFPVVAKICEKIKSLSPRTVTIVGGTHPTFMTEECLSGPGIDFIVRGEGEVTLRETARRLSAGRSCEDVPGLSWREGKVIRTGPDQRLIDNLDELPFPARDLLPLSRYFRVNLPMGLICRKTPSINIITSRGCAYDCAFCSSCRFWGNRFRPRSPENVLAEMEQLKELGVRELKFFDDNLTLDRSRAEKIFQGMIARKLNFSWNTPNGIDVRTLDRGLIRLMKKSGCYEVTLAVESGDSNVLRTIVNKSFDLAEVERKAQLIKQEGLGTYGFFIIGFPGETHDQIEKTLKYIYRLRLDRISLFIANPLPGTRLREICLERGYINPGEADSLDFFQARFSTQEFDQRWLESRRRSCYWSYNLQLLLRNPFKFFSNYSIFIKRPFLLARVVVDKLFLPLLRNGYK